MKKNNICRCGHVLIQHGIVTGSCLVNDPVTGDWACKECKQFKIDNLKYLEQLYENNNSW